MNAPDNIMPAPQGETLPQPRGFFRENRQFRLIICILLWSVISYLLLSHFVLMAVEIKGTSMAPALLDGQRYILFRCPYLWREPRRGEIVVIEDPQDHGLSVKRIVAGPGDIVEIRPEKGVYVNYTKLSEPYLTSLALRASGSEPFKAMRLGPDDYFVLGDNRSWSADSRLYGPVPRKFILGLITKSS